MALIAVIGSVSWAVVAQATTFDVTAFIEVGPSKAAGANADTTSNVLIKPPNAYFISLVTFMPPRWGAARDADVPNGAHVAQLKSVATLGVLNAPCNTANNVVINLLDATTDKSNSFTYDRVAQAITGTNFPGYQLMPSGLERIVEQWPAFLNDIPQLAGKQPIARYAGHTVVAGTQVNLQFLLYAPGVLVEGTEERGYAAVTVLQDPSPGPAAPQTITDNCTTMETHLTTYGTSKDWPATTANEAGYRVRTNPTCGGPNFTFSWQIKSQLDADNDGIENQLDSCPEDAKPAGYDVRATPDSTCSIPLVGDEDCDGIDDSCDLQKNDWSDFNYTDNDGDGFLNRGDNCPTVSNPDNADSDADGIGDACDSTDNTASGHGHEANPESSVTITGSEQACPAATATPTAGTSLTAAAAAGDTQISVVDTTGFAVGDTIQIGSGATMETSIIAAISGTGAGTFTLSTPLQFAHLLGEQVVVMAAGTVTPTPTSTAVTTGTATPTPTPTPSGEFCTPGFPGTYNGYVRVGGQPATSGLELTASVSEQEWGSTFVSGGRYILNIPQKLPISGTCFAGGTLVFKLDGMICTPVQAGGAQWAAGIQDVDLNCAPAATATATATATVTGTPKPPTTGTPTGTPTSTPVKPPPSGGGGLPGGDAGLPLWAMILASWVTLMSAAGLGILVAKR